MREAASASLRKLVGAEASFRPGQLEAVQALVRGDRALVVQRTGWGKSAVYFIAADLLRQQGRGPVLVLSPLLVLMRNQIEAATRLGLQALTFNSSQSKEERQAALAEVGEADLLFVTPESLHSAWFAPDVLSRIEDPSAVVVDEVHCISEWGHNFRPKYRRIRDFLAQLPSTVGVLGTTATATERTIEDIVEQLGDDLVTIRGDLVRSSLHLHVLPPRQQPWRLAWLERFVAAQAGAGIVYVLTTYEADRVAGWLVSRGIDAVPYTGAMEDADRRAIEDRLARNEVQAVVATTALGMGYDKPDLTWVVHYQTPAGPVSYYQQVGRAGRGVPDATGVMLQGPEDADVHDWFITTAYPTEPMATALLAELDRADTGLTESELLARINIPQGRLQAALVILTDDGVVERNGNRYFRTVKRYVYPRERVEAVMAARRREYGQLLTYARGERCLMETLQLALDDPAARPCGRCGPCTGQVLPFDPDPAALGRAARFLWQSAGVLEPRKRWPNQVPDLPVKGMIPDTHRAAEGRVLGRYQDGGYGDEALACRAACQPSDRLLEGIATLLDDWDVQPAWVSWVPSNQHEAFLQRLATDVAELLGLPVRASLTKRAGAVPQRSMQNSPQAATNAWANLTVAPDVEVAGPVLLLDDVVRTRWTLTVATYLLREHGAGAVLPLVLCDVAGSGG
ncbi:MAG: RecQ family ATP-dependent DNA helicase [Nitriliruptoraceae bacterium]